MSSRYGRPNYYPEGELRRGGWKVKDASLSAELGSSGANVKAETHLVNGAA